MSSPAPTAAIDPVPAPSGPAKPLAPTLPEDALRLLDDAQEWSAFSREVAQEPGVWESSVVIEGMHCAACAINIEEALLAVPGVTRAEVSAASGRARVLWTPQRVLPSVWMGAVQQLGYGALPGNDSFASERRKREGRQALWRMAVAGFCMMQVMMYAWPAYIARPGDLTAEMEQLLRWASWVLTLPMMLFSCGPFFSSALRDVAQRRVSMDLPVALGIAMTFVVSSVGTFDPHGAFGREVYFDSLTMFVFFLLTGRWLELRLRDRTAGALEVLMNRLPDSVQRQCADGSFERVAVRRLRLGDLVRVLVGEAFPADGTLLQGETLVDEALLSGESRPLPRGVGAAVIAGSHNLGAPVCLRVERLGAQTRYAQIVALMESASVDKPQLARLADRLAKPFLIAVLLAAGAAAAWGWASDPAHAVMVAVAVLVVTCPCALSLATPAAMLASAGALAKQGVLVRRLQAFEELAQVDTVVFDKTGTLTRGAMRVERTLTRAGIGAEQALEMAAALARYSLHPVSRSLYESWRQARQEAGEDTAEALLPSLLEVRETMGQGVCGRWPHVALWASAGLVRLGSASYCGAAPQSAHVLHACLSDDHGWLATFELQEQVREEALDSVRALQRNGLEVRILSGDGPQAVQAVAKATGILLAQGACTPEDKLRHLREGQQRGRRVVMVGDGLNDGPVLAAANVSFAVGSAVPLAQAQADFVVTSGELGAVVCTLHQARRTMRVVRQNLVWAAAYNALCVPLALLGWLPAWAAGLGMAASSLFVVLNALRLAQSAKSME